MILITFLIVGLCAGILSGLLGIGGGIVLVPAMVYFMKMPIREATGTSLVALLLPVGGLGVYEYWKLGKISTANFKFGLLIAVGLFFGAFLGAKISFMLPDKIIRYVFAFMMFAVGFKFLLTN
jgi:uncharacterized membrane protein YfcA